MEKTVTILFNGVCKKTLKILPNSTPPKKSGKPTYPTKIRLGHQLGSWNPPIPNRIAHSNRRERERERERESLQQYTITTQINKKKLNWGTAFLGAATRTSGEDQPWPPPPLPPPPLPNSRRIFHRDFLLHPISSSSAPKLSASSAKSSTSLTPSTRNSLTCRFATILSFSYKNNVPLAFSETQMIIITFVKF